MDAYVTLEVEVSGSISDDTHYCAIGTHEILWGMGKDYTYEPTFFVPKKTRLI